MVMTMEMTIIMRDPRTGCFVLPLSVGKMADEDDDVENDDDVDVFICWWQWELGYWFSTRSWCHDYNDDIYGDDHDDGDGHRNLEEGRSDLSLLMDVRESGLQVFSLWAQLWIFDLKSHYNWSLMITVNLKWCKWLIITIIIVTGKWRYTFLRHKSCSFRFVRVGASLPIYIKV